MSIATIIRISLAEKEAQKIIEEAKAKAQQIINDAKSQASYYLSEEYIEKLVEQIIKEELKSLRRTQLSESVFLGEEIELLSSISEDEIDRFADELVEVIINESIGELSE